MILLREFLSAADGRPDMPDGPLNAAIVLAAPLRRAPATRVAVALHQDDSRPRIHDRALEGREALEFASGQAETAAIVADWPAGSVAVIPSDGDTG